MGYKQAEPEGSKNEEKYSMNMGSCHKQITNTQSFSSVTRGEATTVSFTLSAFSCFEYTDSNNVTNHNAIPVTLLLMKTISAQI